MTMIQALLVDDEHLALMNLELMLKEMPMVNVIGAYTDPAKAVQASAQLNPDVIFLDIEMPGLNGMMAAELLQIQCPRTKIVFLTAYNNYAVGAFELNALDYLLKPVKLERLLKTIQRLEEQKVEESADKHENKTVIRSFQSLRFQRCGQPLPSIRWRTSKSQELFAYLLHNRNRFVGKNHLIEMLWPNISYKKASTLLYTTIYQVRNCLKQAEIDLQINSVSTEGGYILETDNLLIDVMEWEKGIQALPAINHDNYAEHQRLFDFYAGDYLGDYDYLWAESERQRLRSIWLHHAMGMAEFCTSSDKIPEALTVYQRVVQMYPYFEQAHFGLMKVYNSIGERAAVEERYNLLAELLNRDLSIGPPAEITNWYEEWKQLNLRKL